MDWARVQLDEAGSLTMLMRISSIRDRYYEMVRTLSDYLGARYPDTRLNLLWTGYATTIRVRAFWSAVRAPLDVRNVRRYWLTAGINPDDFHTSELFPEGYARPPVRVTQDVLSQNSWQADYLLLGELSFETNTGMLAGYDPEDQHEVLDTESFDTGESHDIFHDANAYFGDENDDNNTQTR